MTERQAPLARDVAGSIIDHLPLGILLVGVDGLIRSVNSELERLLGYTREALLGEPIELLVPEAAAGRHVGLRNEYTITSTPRQMGHGRDLAARHRDGHVIPVEIGLSPVSIGGENLVLCTVVDVSARRNLEAQLSQTRKMEAIGNLAAGIAHDFKNLIHGILSNAELAMDSVADCPDTGESLEAIVDASLRASDLVDRILTFARKGDRGRGPIQWEPIVRATIRLFRASVPPGVSIELSASSNEASVSASASDLQQIFLNLLTNALHAMAQVSGVIRVKLAPISFGQSDVDSAPGLQAGDYLCLSVIDQGPGVAPELVSRIFEPFFSTKPPEEGTGLGLSVVKRLVLGLGGQISVSESDGSGARFDVYLPVARPLQPGAPSAPQAT